MRFYPSHTNVSNQFRMISGQHTGITESRVLMSTFIKDGSNMDVCTAQMPNYQKLFVNEDAMMNHHLSGYGIYFEEAYIRLLGESVERYALLHAPLIYDSKSKYVSYNNIQSQGASMKWEYMKIYAPEDYTKMENVLNLHDANKDDIIGWLECTKLFEPDKKIFMPHQVLFTGFAPSEEKKDAFFVTGLSKGTACHSNKEVALVSAMMEAVEAHCFMINWYTDRKAKRIVIDDLTLKNTINKVLGKTEVEAVFYDYSLPEMPGYTVAAVLKNTKKKRPLIVVGCQSGLDPRKVIYRALLEALAIYYLAFNGPLLIPDSYLKRPKNSDNFSNLDTNVAFYAFEDDAEKKLALFDNKSQGKILLSSMKNYTGSVSEEFAYVFNKLKKVSEDAVVLDITPLEAKEKGFHVMRTFFPELVQLSLPSFPFTRHPSILKYGGVVNEYPHPVP